MTKTGNFFIALAARLTTAYRGIQRVAVGKKLTVEFDFTRVRTFDDQTSLIPVKVNGARTTGVVISPAIESPSTVADIAKSIACP